MTTTLVIKKRTVQQARAREKRILEGIAEIGPFIRDEDWRLLGYESLEDWVRDKLTPVLRELDASMGPEIRNPIILQIDADQQNKPPAQRLRQREIGELTGVSQQEISRLLSRSTTDSNESTDDLDTASDQETSNTVDAELIDDPAPRDLAAAARALRNSEPVQDSPESAARWINALIEGINEKLDSIADWQEVSDEPTKNQLREELTILRDKITKIEEML